MVGSKKTERCYSHLFFSDSADGVTCNIDNCKTTYKDRNSYNMRKHLSTAHKIADESDDRVKERLKSGQPTLDRFVVRQMTLSDEERQVAFFAEALLPFLAVEGAHYRAHARPPIRSRKTLSEKTVQFAERLLDAALEQLRGATVTLAIDSGTVWNRYLLVMLCANGVSPLPLSCVADDEIGGRLTTEAMQTHMLGLMARLKRFDIGVVGYTSDNAPNMVAVRLPGVWRVRCAAHSIQLVVRDVTSTCPAAVAVLQECESLRKGLGVAAPCETRWNSQLRMARAIHAKQERQPGELWEFIRFFSQFERATRVVEGDTANLLSLFKAVAIVDAACEMDSVFAACAKAAWAARRSRLFESPLLTVVAFLAPNVRIRSRLAYQRALSALQEPAAKSIVARSACGPCTEEHSLTSEINKFTLSPPTALQGDVTTASYKGWWVERAARFPRLAALVGAVLDISPSEASVERGFSKLKLCVPSIRFRLTPEIAAAQVAVKTLLARQALDEVPKMVESAAPPATPASAAAAADDVLEVLVDVSVPAETFHTYLSLFVERVPKRPREDSGARCGICLDKHRDPDEPAVQCSVCNRWCWFSCLGVSFDFQENIEAMKVYECSRCQ